MKKLTIVLCALMTAAYMKAGNNYNLSFYNDGDVITLQDGDGLFGSTSKYVKINIAKGARITLDNATVNSRELTSNSENYAGLNPLGSAYIYLKGSNKITAYGSDYPGILVPANSTVHIYEAEAGSSLFVQSKGSGAGIGTKANKYQGGHIRIHGGHITAYGGDCAAGIGSSSISACGTIRIDGGNVVAVGGKYGFSTFNFAPGIGAPSAGSCGDITITGGTVYARGSENAPGIGSADRYEQWGCGDIEILGGSVSVQGGSNAPGIGAAPASSCGNITVSPNVTSLEVVKGTNATYSIGKEGTESTCGTISVGGIVYPQGITTSPYYYPASVMPCGKPMDVTISDVTATSAKISWSAGYANTRYTVWYNRYLKDEGFDTPKTTATSYTIKNLQPMTEYEVFVQAYCSECNKTSDYTSSMHFVTLGGQGIEEVPSDQVPSTKILRDGQLLILVGDKTYDARGVEVR